MTPYLKESSVFDKEDFVDNLLESFTYDGILTAIPPRFFISTVVGKTSKVGVEMGWTLQEMMELAEKNPDSQLFANVNQVGFPVTKDKLQERIDSTYVLDENGERVLDENGEPLRLTSYNAMFEDWEYFGRAPTEEEIDRTLELISVARVQNNTNSAGKAIKIIIYEEAEAYFSGQKSLDKVVDTIQNRAQLYVSENS